MPKRPLRVQKRPSGEHTPVEERTMSKGCLVLVVLALAAAAVLSNRAMRTHVRSEFHRLVLGNQQVTLDEFNRVTNGMDRDQVVRILNDGRIAGQGAEVRSFGTQGLDLSGILPGLTVPGYEVLAVKWTNDDGSYFGAVFAGGVVKGKMEEGLK